jgi:peptidoglycan/xylan/chitin deacetylase (PgdA/CDA1 family)
MKAIRGAVFSFNTAILTVLVTSMAGAQEPATKSMALTFDDLPYVATPFPDVLWRAQRTTGAILAVLERQEAPAAAFVTESKLQGADEVDARIALLQQWIDAGAILGNHTFAHTDLNSVSVEEFKEDIVRGDVVTRRLTSDRQAGQLYFRYPYTHTGDTEAKKAAIERFLADRGYSIAPHTIDSHDYVFNGAYLYSKERGDSNATRQICETYVDFVVEATEFAEAIAKQMFEREISQTLLLHANDINADCLEGVLRGLRSLGYEFTSLNQAMEDSAYETRDTFVTSYGPTWLWRWMKSKDMEISFRDDPEPPEWVTDLHRRASRPEG